MQISRLSWSLISPLIFSSINWLMKKLQTALSSLGFYLSSLELRIRFLFFSKDKAIVVPCDCYRSTMILPKQGRLDSWFCHALSSTSYSVRWWASSGVLAKINRSKTLNRTKWLTQLQILLNCISLKFQIELVNEGWGCGKGMKKPLNF